jgi:hypothetical protein
VRVERGRGGLNGPASTRYTFWLLAAKGCPSICQNCFAIPPIHLHTDAPCLRCSRSIVAALAAPPRTCGSYTADLTEPCPTAAAIAARVARSPSPIPPFGEKGVCAHGHLWRLPRSSRRKTPPAHRCAEIFSGTGRIARARTRTAWNRARLATPSPAQREQPPRSQTSHGIVGRTKGGLSPGLDQR